MEEEVERDLLEQSAGLLTLGEFFAWLQRCDECIARLEESSRAIHSRLSTGSRHSVVARIARLEGLRNLLRRRFVHYGGDYSAGENDESLFWRDIDAAFESRLLTGAVINLRYIEPRRFLEDARDTVLERVRGVMRAHNSIKINTVFNGEFVAGERRANKSVVTRNHAIFRSDDPREWYDLRVVEPILASLEEFQERDSGWALSRILNLTVNVNKYNPLHAGCHVRLPPEIESRRAVTNVRSMDDACFAWSVTAALYPAATHSERESSYPHYTSVLNLEGIEHRPMTFDRIKKFESLNDISVNVYCIERDGGRLAIIPIRLAVAKGNRHANLLYVRESRVDNAGHFLCIRDLLRLAARREEEQAAFLRQGSLAILVLVYEQIASIFSISSVDACIISAPTRLRSHVADCSRINDCAVVLPSDDDKWLRFENHCRKERVPFVVYVDLECILEKIEGERNEGAPRHARQHHRVFSVGYYVHCSYDESLFAYPFRRDEECVAWFVRELVVWRVA